MNIFLGLIKDESGATAIEYAFIALLISLVIIAALRFIGTSVTNTFNNVNNGFNR